MTKPNTVFIGLGSNLENPVQQIQTAFVELACLEDLHIINQSSLYSSKPMGPADQPDYINAVISIETSLEPIALLDQLQALENSHQRVREQRWGARTLDLDILLWNDEIITDDRLTIPHVGIALRNFVLVPLFEINQELKISGLGNVQDLLNNIETNTIVKVAA